MDALSRIRAKINDYPGYASEGDIERSDQLLRAYVGERLAELQERCGPGPAADAIEPLIVRTAFADQRVLRPLEQPAERIAAPDPVLEADGALLDTADRAAAVTAAEVDAYCASVANAFDERERQLVAAGIAFR